MSGARDEAERLARERSEARAVRDFARADELRDAIAALGFDVADTASGFELRERAANALVDPRSVPDLTSQPARLDASVHVLYEGHRSDLYRFVAGMGASAGDFEVVVTDNASGEEEWIDNLCVGRVRAIHFDRAIGWAEARNRAALNSLGRVVVVCDLSVEPQGDVVRPLVDALEDESVGVCGPWGLVTDDMREFHESPGPDVDAIEGYVLAMRRDVFARTGFDPWFKWYRHADLDLSFRVRSLGYRARVVTVPAQRHEHRGWSSVPEPERSARSKRNFYRFLDRWKDQGDLITGSGR